MGRGKFSVRALPSSPKETREATGVRSQRFEPMTRTNLLMNVRVFTLPSALSLILASVGCVSGSLSDSGGASDEPAGGGASSDGDTTGGTSSTGEMSSGGATTAAGAGGDSSNSGGSASGGSDAGTPAAEQCSDGILNGAETVCCAASCGTCGGTGCSSLPGGAEACCAGPIADAGQPCNEFEAPCVLDGAADGTGGESGDGPTDVLYENPLDDSADVQEVKDSLVQDQTDGLLSLVQGGQCGSGNCLSVRHDYEGQNIKTRKVNGEYPFDDYATEATFSYRVKFESGFDFRKQGKLPGIIPLSPHFGGNANDPVHPDKWSVRVMWLKSGDADGDGEVRADLYLYDQDRPLGKSGEHNNQPGFGFTTGTWHTVTIYLRLNSNGATRDGRAEMWVDDQLLACRTNKLFRGNTGQNTEIQKIAFHNYFGGSQDYDWPHEEQFAFFDDLLLVAGRDTPYVPDASECESHIRT